MKKKIFAVAFGLVLGVGAYLSSTNLQAQKTDTYAIEECVNNATKCVTCGGSCIVACCDKAKPVTIIVGL